MTNPSSNGKYITKLFSNVAINVMQSMAWHQWQHQWRQRGMISYQYSVSKVFGCQ